MTTTPVAEVVLPSAAMPTRFLKLSFPSLVSRPLRVLALLFLALLVACSNLSRPTQWTFSEAELQAQLQRQFPLEQRLMEVLEVRATQPQVQLLPQSNRLQAVMDVHARERLLATQTSGRLDFDAALRWQQSDRTVRLDRVRVRDFVQVQAPARADPTGARRSSGERLAAALAEHMLENLVLYRLPADKAAQLDRAGVQVAALTITSKGLEITFAPKARP